MSELFWGRLVSFSALYIYIHLETKKQIHTFKSVAHLELSRLPGNQPSARENVWKSVRTPLYRNPTYHLEASDCIVYILYPMIARQETTDPLCASA
jgi:hypothetical protein